jgi:uncharacterized RDD family membrane protein YckC/curved DNA-binding protein CbpA
MDDYYELLGVDSGAATGDIRSAYRDKKAALDAKGDKVEIGKLNKAWNVLSDPYQRGRYDQQRSEAGEAENGDGEVETVGAARASTSSGGTTASPPARRRLFEPRPRGNRPPPPEPTIDIPAGKTLAQQRPRMMALFVDVAVVVLLLFTIVPIGTNALQKRWYPEEHARLDEIGRSTDKNSELSKARDKADDSDSAADKAEKNHADNAAALRKTADADKAKYDALVDETNDLSRKVFPAGLVVVEILMVVYLAYLVVPSALTGQTLGKRLQKIKVVRLDGSPIGWSGALVRYLPLVAMGNVLALFGQQAGILGLFLIAGLFFIVLGWMRNPNKQALQDRVAKTLVVDA